MLVWVFWCFLFDTSDWTRSDTFWCFFMWRFIFVPLGTSTATTVMMMMMMSRWVHCQWSSPTAILGCLLLAGMAFAVATWLAFESDFCIARWDRKIRILSYCHLLISFELPGCQFYGFYLFGISTFLPVLPMVWLLIDQFSSDWSSVLLVIM